MENIYLIKDKVGRPCTLRFKSCFGWDTPQDGKFKCVCNEIEKQYCQSEPDKRQDYGKWLEWKNLKNAETLTLSIKCDFKEGYPSDFCHIGAVDIISVNLNDRIRTYGYLWNFNLEVRDLNGLGLSKPILDLVESFLQERKAEYLCGVTTDKKPRDFWKHLNYNVYDDREIFKKL